MMSLQRATDRAIAQENRRALADPSAPLVEVRHPQGTPEHDAYAERLRAELAAWVAGTGEYAR